MQAMFKSRDFYPHKAQIGDQILEPSLVNHTGLANYLDRFEKDKKDTKPGIWPVPKRSEVMERRRSERIKAATEKLEAAKAVFDPQSDPKCTENAYNTLFVGNLRPTVDETALRAEFSQVGPVKSVRVVVDKKSSMSRRYGFVEFVKEKDMAAAFKKYKDSAVTLAQGAKLVVDVERGRTVRGWLPRRLGGGLGGRTQKPRKSQDKDARRGTPSSTLAAYGGRAPTVYGPAGGSVGAGGDRYGGGDRDREGGRDQSRDRYGDRSRDGDRSRERSGSDRYGSDRYGSDRDRGGGGRDRYGDRGRGRDDSRGYGGDKGASVYGGGGGGVDRYGGGRDERKRGRSRSPPTLQSRRRSRSPDNSSYNRGGGLYGRGR
jgi:U1 small nuclear ribonucleoprotein